MIDGIPLIDVHVHVANLPGLKLSWDEWTGRFDADGALLAHYDGAGTLVPERFHEYIRGEGVDLGLLVSEYSPKVTGIQSADEMVPLVEHDPSRLRFIANLNPHMHYPAARELERQLELGAVALKIHPVHGGFPVNERELYPAYALCEERGITVVIHFGTSVFPGATNRYADPGPIEDVIRDFPGLTVVLAHGGRGWWYDAAAVMTQSRPNVWIEISGLPPQRLPHYFARFDLRRLAKRLIFGTDWPGVPSIRANALAVTRLDLDREDLEGVFYRNALAVYRLEDAWRPPQPE